MLKNAKLNSLGECIAAIKGYVEHHYANDDTRSAGAGSRKGSSSRGRVAVRIFGKQYHELKSNHFGRLHVRMSGLIEVFAPSSEVGAHNGREIDASRSVT